MNEMTSLPSVEVEMLSRSCFASTALTAIITRFAFLAAATLSVETSTFPGNRRFRVEMFLFVMVTFETFGDLAMALATASPILPAPRTAITNAFGP